MAELHDDDGELVATNTFSMDCPSCGPATIHFLDGEMVPHGCSYQPPVLVIDCSQGEPMPPSTLARSRRRRTQDAIATIATAVIALLLVAVGATPIAWFLITFWRWVL